MAEPKKLTEADDSTTVAVQLGETIELDLAENPSTGYGWELAPTEGAAEVVSSYAAAKVPEGVVGAGGSRVFTITPTRTGPLALSLVYRRAWAPEPTDRVLQIILDVAGGGAPIVT